MDSTATTTTGHHTGHASGCDCGSCGIAPFERNNYFTGKLLLERDFTDEQQYLRDKLRHHNQRLHGSGVVCGLRLVQHPNADCRDRFVRLTPGTAIDCCGNDILVTAEQDIELAALPAVAGIDPTDEKLHDIAICLTYHECGNEPVPVLYDECGCDDDRCLPNRILESFRIDAVLDPPLVPPGWTGPTATRVDDLAVAGARHVVLADVAVAVADDTAVHLVDATGAVVASKDLGTAIQGLDRAAGGHLYVTRDDGAGAITVTVLDGATLAQTHEKKLASSAVPAATAMLAGGRLAILQSSPGTLAVFGTALETGSTAAAKTVSVDKDRSLLAAHPTDAVAYVAADSASGDPNPGRVDAVDVDAGTVTALATLPAGSRFTGIAALAEGADGQLLALLDGARAAAVDLGDGSVSDEVTLAADGRYATGSPWAWAVSTGSGQSHVQPVGVQRQLAGADDVVGAPITFDGEAHGAALDEDAGMLFVPYTGAGAANPGGVAVFVLASTSCRDAWEALEDCPSCERPDCVVVGTIRGYRPGFAVLDLDPDGTPPDQDADAAASIARIDNHLGRTRLRSTAALERAIACLLNAGVGRDGQDGKDGTNGTSGTDGTDGTNGTDGVNGTNGTDGEGLEQDLTQIVQLSWKHADQVMLNLGNIIDPAGDRHDGLVIVFSREVDVSLIDAAHVFTVDAPNPFLPDDAQELGLRCRCPLAGRVEPVQVTSEAGGLVETAEVTPGAGFSKAIAFVFEDITARLVLRLEDRADFGVQLRGEFVVDSDGRAVDAEFTRAELPSGDRPSGSTFGVQGGLFQSWFRVVVG